jgi:hypothetical protein
MNESKDKIVLEVGDLHWLGEGDGSYDLCAHGSVVIKIGNYQLSDPSDNEWCVSAAALYLLRTLTSDHTRDKPVGEHLIPHCGHSMLKVEGKEDVLITGCYIGIDWEVRHRGDKIVLKPYEKEEVEIDFSEWFKAVCLFADKVKEFYARSSKKVPTDPSDADGFEVFISEWNRRRMQAEKCG